MCPDKQLLSVYIDGEMPSPWKEKLEQHAAACENCARTLAVYRNNSLPPAGCEAADIAAAQDRVRQKLDRRLAFQEREQEPFTRRYPRESGIWNRRISIPVPAAAAALVFIVLAFLLMVRINGNVENTSMSIAAYSGFESPGIIPAVNMEDVLQYLGSRDSGETLILQLPESRSFVNYSEPAIVKAADYSRNTPARRKP